MLCAPAAEPTNSSSPSPAPVVSPGELLTTGGLVQCCKRQLYGLGGRENGGNYLFRAVIGALEMPKTERHPHKEGNSVRLGALRVAALHRLIKLLRIAEQHHRLRRLRHGEHVGERHLRSLVHEKHVDRLERVWP